ncbi:MAG: hypothetical protein M1833_006939 [Piccolia ochrophora]|nr:MAG: hypothetical protein M1833_006939 [Piccolia ochrophora]
MDLPLEIREQIYGGLLSDRSHRNVQVLRTSQQIYAEAQPFLFKSPLTFQSQFDLYDWMENMERQQLHHVRCISLKLIDVICHDGLDALSIQATQKSSASSLTRIYEADISRLTATLKSLPNLQDLTVYKQMISEPDHIRSFHRSFYGSVSQQCTSLRNFCFYSDQVSLEFLGSLRNLRTLRFTGFSTSTPKGSLKILRKLTRLEGLELFGPPPALGFQHRPGFKGTKVVQSITPEVIQGMRPLRLFTICEVHDTKGAEDETFLNEKMLLALRSAHRRTLDRLKISTDFMPSPATVNAMVDLLSASTIHELELGWPGLDEEIFDALPRSLSSLQINVGSSLPPTRAVHSIVDRRKQLPKLRDVTLMIDWRESGSKEIVANADAAIARLRAAGIQATRGKWYPIIFDRITGSESQ